MKKIYILTLILLSFSLLNCGASSEKQNFDDNLNSRVEEYNKQREDIKNLNITIEYLPLKDTALNISVMIANNTDHDILLFHDIKSPLYLTLIEDGVKINHIDTIIDFSKGGIIMNPGTFQLYNIDVSSWYYTHKGTHRYEIILEPLNGWKSNPIEFDATLTENGGKH